jgi:hypothetical protein
MATSPITTFDCAKISPFIYPELARTMTVRLGASLTLAKGTVLGELSATPGTFEDYSNAASDGTEVARAILPYDVKTDADGLITLGDVSTGMEQGQKYRSIDVWITGYFRTTDLTGLDANGAVDLGRVVRGTVADGVLRVI